MPVMTLDQFAAVVRESAENVGTQFERPDDDWMPVMEVCSGDGQIFVIGIDGQFLRNDFTKDILADRIMKPMIDGLGGKMVATVFSAWTVQLDTDPRGTDLPKPSEHPDRIEVVLVTAVSPTDTRVWFAEILRDDDQPPTLGPWDEWPKPTLMEGRFIDGVQDALRDSSGKPRPEFLKRLEQMGGGNA